MKSPFERRGNLAAAEGFALFQHTGWTRRDLAGRLAALESADLLTAAELAELGELTGMADAFRIMGVRYAEG